MTGFALKCTPQDHEKGLAQIIHSMTMEWTLDSATALKRNVCHFTLT